MVYCYSGSQPDGVTAIVALRASPRRSIYAPGMPSSLLIVKGKIDFDEDGNVVLWRVNGRSLDNAQFFSPPIQVSDRALLLLPAVDLRLFQVELGKRRNSGK
ncbi:MAG UNVERIFIED_CONTAM: hypothetical protein LVT10_14925 [Anaerolineae bacterium]